MKLGDNKFKVFIFLSLKKDIGTAVLITQRTLSLFFIKNNYEALVGVSNNQPKFKKKQEINFVK